LNRNDISPIEQSWQTIQRPDEGASISFTITVETQLRVDGEDQRFQIQEDGFAICMGGKIYAYRNHCPHAGSPLDWLPNQFFSDDGQALMCHTHGALFDPITGDCISGPCPRGLYPLDIQIQADCIQVPTRLIL